MSEKYSQKNLLIHKKKLIKNHKILVSRLAKKSKQISGNLPKSVRPLTDKLNSQTITCFALATSTVYLETCWPAKRVDLIISQSWTVFCTLRVTWYAVTYIKESRKLFILCFIFTFFFLFSFQFSNNVNRLSITWVVLASFWREKGVYVRYTKLVNQKIASTGLVLQGGNKNVIII